MMPVRFDTIAENPPLQPIVVVPVHKPQPDPTEVVSIRNCGIVFQGRHICFVAPEQLDLRKYQALVPNAGQIRVPRGWMASIGAYNSMMISPDFFERVKDFTHVLIHEPDAIVLRDELDHWCAQPFDYIGAPWFVTNPGEGGALEPTYVGNYGFSLMRVSAARDVLASQKRWYPMSKVFADAILGFFGNPALLKRAKLAAGSAGQLHGACRLYGPNCDIFWSFAVPALHPDFEIAGPAEALKFSWEAFPARCLELSGGEPPFGVHAWAKIDPAFMFPFLSANGIDLGDAGQTAAARDSSHPFQYPRRPFHARKTS